MVPWDKMFFSSRSIPWWKKKIWEILSKKFSKFYISLTVDNLGGFMCTSRWGLTSTITWYICRIDLPTEGAYNVLEKKLFWDKRCYISKTVRDTANLIKSCPNENGAINKMRLFLKRLDEDNPLKIANESSRPPETKSRLVAKSQAGRGVDFMLSMRTCCCFRY